MNKRVLFVINTLGLAGAEVALIELLGHMPEEYEIDLYVLMGQGELAERLPENVNLLNKNFSTESVLSAKGRLRMAKTVGKSLFRRGSIILLFPYLVKNFWEMLLKRRLLIDKLLWRALSDGGLRLNKEYDLAVAFLEGGSAYYVADHVEARRKAAFIHIDYEQAGYTRRLDQDCFLKYDVLFPIADEIKESFLHIYPECSVRTQVFHNIINRERILELAEEPGGFSDDYQGKRILTVGRLNKQKAYPVAIEAMKLLKESGEAVRWYVLGEGAERRELERLIAEYGLQEDFLLPGAVKNPFPYYRQTDLYVHATGFEGKSIAIQEAQVLGCAIIASDCSGNREQIVDGEDGLLCKLEPEELCETIRTLLRDEAMQKKFREASVCKRVSYEEDLHMLTDLLQ